MFLKRQCEIVTHIAVMFSIKLGVYEHVVFNYDTSQTLIKKNNHSLKISYTFIVLQYK